MSMNDSNTPQCPVPVEGSTEVVTLAHGEGGRLMRQLIRRTIVATVGGNASDDAARLPTSGKAVVVSTDSFVVSPLSFPGGDIGTLAVFGTVNDLAVAGAKCQWISLSLIIEEGLPIAKLQAVLESVAKSADRVGVEIVTGDTKVVPRGAADQLFINTTGIGVVLSELPGPSQIQPGDQLLVTGPIGRHGMAVMCRREGLQFDPAPSSDCAPLLDSVTALIDAGVPIRAMRDATRGGVAAVLHEWAETSNQSMVIEESLVPVGPATRGACEVLGLDPLNVANEGTMVVAVAEDSVDAGLAALRSVESSSSATRIGQVRSRELTPVMIRRAFATELPLDEPTGAPLPRIC